MIRSIVILSALLFSCNKNSKTSAVTVPVEHVTATKDQQERRNQSEKYCKSHDVKVYSNPNSLFVDPEDEVTIRTKDEIVDRALALCFIGLKSEGLDQKHLDKMNKDFHISVKLTEVEKEYVFAKEPTEQQKINANWRYESLHVLLWSLSFIDSLNYPDQACNVANDVKIIRDLTEQQFRKNAKLRTKKEILDQADLILRLDWACVDARVNEVDPPGKLDKGIVFERHHSLNWLIKYMNQEWDDVAADT